MTATPPGLWPALLALLLGLAGLAALLGQPRWRAWRRARIAARPFPAAWRRILRQRVPAVARLPADLQQQLKRHVLVFLAEKPVIGCAGQPVDDEVRVVIAAQACLLLLGQPPQVAPFPRLKQVLVYPGAFVVPAAQAAAPGEGGVVHARPQALAGQSWAQGQVVLGWAEVLAGAVNPGDGENVVVHEFAHQIDQDKGHADGRPWRPGAAARRRWAGVMDTLFARLQHTPSALLGSYAASAPAELFAVLSERFFEQPQALAEAEPEAYRELALLYRLHPAGW